jgi:hemerythrin-like domain-containing protein
VERLTVDHPLFQFFRDEHDQILTRLGHMQRGKILLDDVKWLWENAELKHHQREEKVLFNFLLSNKLTEGGGPLCMFFMDQYILDPPLDRAQTITARVPPIEPHQEQIFETGSVMRIPVNEHRAGKDILKFLLERWETLGESEIIGCFKAYKLLQAENIQKEETCFYFMCAQILSVTEADSLLNELKKPYDGGHMGPTAPSI